MSAHNDGTGDSRAQAMRRLVITHAQEVYRLLGWGWREEVYREALARDLAAGGLSIAVEVAMPIYYRGQPLSHVSVRWDMLVGDCVLVELKAVQNLRPAALRQCERYAGRYVAGRNEKYMCVVLNFTDRAKASLQWSITS